MKMIVTTEKHSYMVEEIDATIEVGSVVFIPENKTWHMITAPGVMEAINGSEVEESVKVSTAEALAESIAAGGSVTLETDIDAPTAVEVKVDTELDLNGKTITVKEDTVGDGVFKVTDGTLTINGKGTINGLGKNDWSMCLWATDNGKIVVNGGYFTNLGAKSEQDSQHFDLIYASENGYVEINNGEFNCETPKWTLNIKNNSRETAKIVVKGGKFHGFNPMEAEEGNFVAPGYKVIESDGIFTVVAE